MGSVGGERMSVLQEHDLSCEDAKNAAGVDTEPLMKFLSLAQISLAEDNAVFFLWSCLSSGK